MKRKKKDGVVSIRVGKKKGGLKKLACVEKQVFKPTSPQPLIEKGHSTRYISEMFLWNCLAQVCVNETGKLRSLLKTTCLKRLFVV